LSGRKVVLNNTQETSSPWVNKQGNYRICLQWHL